MDGVIDRADFERWLVGHGAEDVVGETCDPSACPLASYIRDTKGVDALVYGDVWRTAESYFGMPEWAEEFVELVDSLPDDAVTAEQALAVLAEVTE